MVPPVELNEFLVGFIFGMMVAFGSISVIIFKVAINKNKRTKKINKPTVTITKEKHDDNFRVLPTNGDMGLC